MLIQLSEDQREFLPVHPFHDFVSVSQTVFCFDGFVRNWIQRDGSFSYNRNALSGMLDKFLGLYFARSHRIDCRLWARFGSLGVFQIFLRFFKRKLILGEIGWQFLADPVDLKVEIWHQGLWLWKCGTGLEGYVLLFQFFCNFRPTKVLTFNSITYEDFF